ncbi:MAG: hypothetical protein V8Q27_09185, partial [Eubacteriales bacterium]
SNTRNEPSKLNITCHIAHGDANHRIIGFGGRVMGDAKPKYLNSPETTASSIRAGTGTARISPAAPGKGI